LFATTVGIDPVMLPRMFHAFAQERQDGSRPERGLGLGLAIVRNPSTHGGSVTLESDGRGRGTVSIRPISGTTALAPSVCARRRSAGCPW
jgi:two-component system CheB/CheR fusion protein